MRWYVMIMVFTLRVCGADSIAFVKTIQGEAVIKRDNTVIVLQSGASLFQGDMIETHSGANLGVVFNDGTRIAIGPKTLLTIDNYLFQPSQNNYKFDVTLPKGKIVFESGKIGKLAPEKVGVKVPQGIIGIRGTKFVVEAD